MKNYLKRMSILALCLALLCSMTLSASAATQSAKAATLRLEKMQGTVTVQNGSGTTKKATANMKLLSGYTVSTGKASYAYISLDDSKAIKLDASSKVSIQKAGKKLEVKIVSGKVMFNVSTPLTSQESLTIRTSTMVTGVRGTAGWFEADAKSSSVYLLEGSLDVYSAGNNTATNITSGQQVTSQKVETPSGSTTDQTETSVNGFTHEDVPGFVATEVSDNHDLQKRMQENDSPIDSDKVSENAQQKLKKDESAAAKQEQQIQKQEKDAVLEAQKDQSTSGNNLFDNNKPSVPVPEPTPTPTPTPDPDPEPDPDPTPDPEPDPDPTPDPEPDPDPTPDPEPDPEPEITDTLENPTQETLELALSKYDEVSVSFTADSGTYEFDAFTIPENKTLHLTGGIMDIVSADSEQDFVISGAVYIGTDAMLRITSTETFISETGSLTNDGMLRYSSAKALAYDLHNAGMLLNNSTIDLQSGTLNNTAAGQFINNESGFVYLSSLDSADSVASILEFSSTLPPEDQTSANYGEIYVYANNQTENYIHVGEGAAYHNNGKIYLETGGIEAYCAGLYVFGYFYNEGTLCNHPGSCICNYGYLINGGTIENAGQFSSQKAIAEEDKSAYTYIDGALNNLATGKIDISQKCMMLIKTEGMLHNLGCISIDGGLLQTDSDAHFENYGDIYNHGALHNIGTLTNSVLTEDDKQSVGSIINASDGYFYNYGVLENVDDSNNINNFGYMVNTVTTDMDWNVTSPASLTIFAGHLFNNDSSTFINEYNGTVVVGDGNAKASFGAGGGKDSIVINNGNWFIGKNALLSIDLEGEFVSHGQLEVSGTVENYGRLLNTSTLVADNTNESTVPSAGKITITTSGQIVNYNNLENGLSIQYQDKLYSPSIINQGALHNCATTLSVNDKTIVTTGKIGIMDGTLRNEPNSIFRNEFNENFDTMPTVMVYDRGTEIADAGELVISTEAFNSGIITVCGNGKVSISEKGSLTSSGKISVYGGGTLENAGTLINKESIEIQNATLSNTGTLTNYNVINSPFSAIILNSGTLQNMVEPIDDGTKFHSGIISLYNKGTLTNTVGSTFENNGLLINDMVMAALIQLSPSSKLTFNYSTDEKTVSRNNGVILVGDETCLVFNGDGKLEGIGTIDFSEDLKDPEIVTPE